MDAENASGGEGGGVLVTRSQLLAFRQKADRVPLTQADCEWAASTVRHILSDPKASPRLKLSATKMMATLLEANYREVEAAAKDLGADQKVIATGTTNNVQFNFNGPTDPSERLARAVHLLTFGPSSGSADALGAAHDAVHAIADAHGAAEAIPSP